MAVYGEILMAAVTEGQFLPTTCASSWCFTPAGTCPTEAGCLLVFGHVAENAREACALNWSRSPHSSRNRLPFTTSGW